ncbi:hypothetical protein [Caballeronia concitans]|jgi:hypothetical protein|uniref:Uncharacterized protein n=1 Tax=Caballeronia concitans TaxID=1777133 RepID=A0A658QXU4_9BURK|nr:hypothetical protein [Caballeronia concitans]KIG03174.1 hypothetical protein BurMR1_5036 [Burkholderia sp. MR1]SAL31315.1 hypothetical protein AWB72_02746 [Caballeronia concitans]
MRTRYVILEKIAFTLLTLSAVVDASYITWEKHPNFRENVTELVKMGSDLNYATATIDGSTMMPLAFN